MIKIAIGIITYKGNTAKYLPAFLESLKKQTRSDFTLYVYDNTDDGSRVNIDELQKSDIKKQIFGNGLNIGFGAAYNYMLAKATDDNIDYFLVLNCDMVLELDMLERLIAYAVGDQGAIAVIPKLLRWDFANNVKTKVIDSYGIVADRKLRFFEKFNGLVDRQQVLAPERVFGFTGAAALFNMRLLEESVMGVEIFDELMFMYKEDCDLSIRFNLAGLKIVVVPSAVAYHDRTAVQSGRSSFKIVLNRSNKSPQIKSWSLRNQFIIYLKYWRFMDVGLKFSVAMQAAKMMIYILLFERFLLKDLWQVLGAYSAIREKSFLIKNKLTRSEFVGLFSGF